MNMTIGIYSTLLSYIQFEKSIITHNFTQEFSSKSERIQVAWV